MSGVEGKISRDSTLFSPSSLDTLSNHFTGFVARYAAPLANVAPTLPQARVGNFEADNRQKPSRVYIGP